MLLEHHAAIGARLVIATSSTLTRAEFGAMKPATTLSSVDFPQPDGPSRQTNSPGATSRLDVLHGHPARGAVAERDHDVCHRDPSACHLG